MTQPKPALRLRPLLLAAGVMIAVGMILAGVFYADSARRFSDADRVGSDAAVARMDAAQASADAARAGAQKRVYKDF